MKFALKQAREQIQKLELCIQSSEGEALGCDLVFIIDFSEELEEDGLVIQVLGFSAQTLQKFWPDVPQMPTQD